MIELLDELTEVPFDVYWDKYQEQNPGDYSKIKTQMQWFYMYPDDRVDAFTNISKGIFVLGQGPIAHLQSFLSNNSQ